MNIKIPDTFRGIPVKGAIERALAQKIVGDTNANTSANNVSPVIVQASINREDFIQIPQHNSLISKYEPDWTKGFNYDTSHRKVFDNGLRMAYIREFTDYFKSVQQAAEGRGFLHDGNNTQLSRAEAQVLWNYLSSKDRTPFGKDCWSWLNAKFVEGTGFNEMDLEEITGVDSQGDFIIKRHPLEPCLFSDSYARLNFNSQGLISENSKTKDQSYKQGKNLYFYYPRKDSVARFNANSGGAFLNCDRDPQDSDSTLGVFVCAEGAQKR